MPIQVAIGSYNYLFGAGVKKLLEGERDIHVVGIFDEETDVEEIAKMNPSIVLLDFTMFQGLAELSGDSKIKILLFIDRKTYLVSEKRVSHLITKGVVGILPPGADPDLLKKAIRAIHSGELWLDRKTMSSILSQDNSIQKNEIKLTKSEKEIVSLICQGLRNKEIALKLRISEQTVKSHCNRIYKKVGISDRLQLAIYFMQNGG
jgi:two-component system, NarL family, nitrate/nitrite response regulator NarL